MNVDFKPLNLGARALSSMLLLVLYGCSLSATRSAMPAWIHGAQIVPGHITAVGHAAADPDGNVARQRRLARLIAEGELAENIHVITSTHISTAYQNQRKSIEQDDLHHSQLVLDINRVQRLAEWTDPNTQSHYVLIAYPQTQHDTKP